VPCLPLLSKLLHHHHHPTHQEPELLEAIYASSPAHAAELGELQLRRAAAAVAAACAPGPGGGRADEAAASRAVQALADVAAKLGSVGLWGCLGDCLWGRLPVAVTWGVCITGASGGGRSIAPCSYNRAPPTHTHTPPRPPSAPANQRSGRLPHLQQQPYLRCSPGLELDPCPPLPPSKPLQHKELGAAAKSAGELASLRREQLALERSSGQSLFLGLSLSATLAQCLRLGHEKQAAALRRSFSVGEARWWWLRLRLLAEGRDWEGLQALAEEKRAPVAGGGWGPLLDAARRAGAPRAVVAR
jgi:hypothetical protein